jgi:hypothetical protein
LGKCPKGDGGLSLKNPILKIVLDKELTISLYQDHSPSLGVLLMTVSLDGGGCRPAGGE